MSWFSRNKSPKVLSPQDAYNLWAATYSAESNPVKANSDRMVEKLLLNLGDQSFLDFGCGAGKFCELAESQSAARIVGIDVSPAMIEQAKKVTTRTEYLCGDLENLKLDHHAFDTMLSALVLGHIKNLDLCLDRLLPSLRPGGTLIITDFHPFLTLKNAKRTFLDKASGQQFEVQHHLHLFADYVRGLTRNGMIIQSLEEPTYNDIPVIFALKATKR